MVTSDNDNLKQLDDLLAARSLSDFSSTLLNLILLFPCIIRCNML